MAKPTVDPYEGVSAGTFVLMLGHTLGWRASERAALHRQTTAAVAPRVGASAKPPARRTAPISPTVRVAPTPADMAGVSMFHQSPSDTRLGDAILACKTRLALLEFKREEAETVTELNKDGKAPFLEWLRNNSQSPLATVAEMAHFIGVGSTGTAVMEFFPYPFVALDRAALRLTTRLGAPDFIAALLDGPQRGQMTVGVGVQDFLEYVTVLVRAVDTAKGKAGTQPFPNTAGYLVGVGPSGEVLAHEYADISMLRSEFEYAQVMGRFAAPSGESVSIAQATDPKRGRSR